MPALGDRTITVEVRKIATRGEYAGWRATRATGDFDLRTFEIRAYPVEPVPGLRPGMSVYADWKRPAPDVGAAQPGTAQRRGARSRAGSGATASRCSLVFGVPLIAFALLSLTFSNAVIRDLSVDVVDQDHSRDVDDLRPGP